MINAWYPNWPLCPKEVLQWYMDLRTWWPGTGGSIWKILQYQYNSRTTRWLIFYDQLINDCLWWHSSVSHRAAPSSCLRPLVPQLWGSLEAWVEGRWVFQRFSVTWTKREPRTWWSTSSWTRQVTESSRKASCWLLLCWKEETPPFRWDDVTDGETKTTTFVKRYIRCPSPCTTTGLQHRWSFIGPLSVWSVKPTHWIYTM